MECRGTKRQSSARRFATVHLVRARFGAVIERSSIELKNQGSNPGWDGG